MDEKDVGKEGGNEDMPQIFTWIDATAVQTIVIPNTMVLHKYWQNELRLAISYFVLEMLRLPEALDIV